MQGSPPPAAEAFPPTRRPHGLAIASVISAALSCCCPIVPAVLAIVLGVIASGEIRDRPNEYTGRDMATIGVSLGVVLLVLQIVGALLFVALGMSEDRITALAETPPADVFSEHDVPADGVRFLRENGYVAADERIVLYYDDSFLEKFAALSVLTDRRVLTVFDGEAEWIPLHEVRKVRYVEGSIAKE